MNKKSLIFDAITWAAVIAEAIALLHIAGRDQHAATISLPGGEIVTVIGECGLDVMITGPPGRPPRAEDADPKSDI